MSETQFDSIWQKQLKSSYQSSIYWNAHPQSPDRIDLYYADINDLTFATNWGEQLIGNHQLKVEINASAKEKENLIHIFTQTNNLQDSHRFGFGFPFFIAANTNKEETPLVAPLFIWELSIQASPNRLDSWIIQHDETHAIKVNEHLIHHLEDKYQLKLKDKCKTMALQKSINHQSLSKLCNELIVGLNLHDGRTNIGIYPFPKATELNLLLETGAIHWSGILGLFPFLAPSLMQEAKLEPEQALQIGNYAHQLPLFRNDPFQKEAILALDQNEIIAITGQKGTGKTYTLNNILCNALSNGKKCLVVSNNTQSFLDIQELLKQKDLDNLSLILRNDHKDKLELMNQLRKVLARSSKEEAFDNEAYQLSLNKYQREHKKLDAAYKILSDTIFGNYSWTETVGHFLRSNRLEGKELLASQLNPQDFVFTFVEYEMLKMMVESTEPIYEKLPTLKHPLNNLEPEIFLHKEKEEARVFLQHKLKAFIDKAASLQHRYILKLDAYVHKLREHYEHHYHELDQQLELTKNKITDYSSQFGAEFESSSVVNTSKLHVYGVFFDKHKNILNAKGDISEQYDNLIKLYENRAYFDYEFPKTEDGKNISKIRQYLADFGSNLLHWRHRNPGIIQEQVQKLSSQTVHINLDYKEQIIELEYALDVLIEELNTAGIYRDNLKNNRLTIPKRQQFLEDIIEQLETSLYHLRDFDNFYDWRRHWLKINEKSKKLIKAIVKVKPKNWTAAFESWYFHNHLLLNHQAQLPDSDILLQNFIESSRKLTTVLPTQIRQLWKKRQVDTLREFKRVDRERYKLIFETGDQQTILQRSLKELFQIDFPAFTDMFPVIMLSPELAAEALPNMEQFFDLVLFDEAHQIASFNAFPAWKLAKQVVVAGEENMPLDHGQSNLLDFAEQAGAKKIQLHYLHQNTAPSIARFKNNYLYDNKLKLLRTNIEDENAIQVQAVNGIYDEDKQINKTEIEAVLDALQGIGKTAEHKYPRVGIICFSQNQRNAIQQSLLQIKQLQKTGHTKIKDLELAGLKLRNWDESFEAIDLAIVTLGFGRTEQNSNFTKSIESLNENGLFKLKAIFAASFQSILLIHSIPQDMLPQYLAQPGKASTYLIANFIQYGSDLEHGRQLSAELNTPSVQLRGRHSKRLFIEEVEQSLRPYLEQGRMHLNASTENLSLALVIKALNKDAPTFVLQTDGFFSDADTGAYAWEQYLREEVNFLGLETLPTWSINWWKNPKLEARKLASIIIRNDAAINPKAIPQVEETSDPEGQTK